MTEKLIVTYLRKSTLPKYCRDAWAKASHIIKVECLFCDWSEDRKEWGKSGIYFKDKNGCIIPSDIFRPDVYIVRLTNVKGTSKDREFKTKEEANNYFKSVKLKYPDLIKC